MKTAAIVGFLAALPLLGGCRGQTQGGAVATTGQAGWDVLKNGEKVQWIEDKPGLLVSRAAPPPPPSKPVTHAFLGASSYDIMAEGALYKLLQQARSFDDYVRLLKENGYEVVPAAERP